MECANCCEAFVGTYEGYYFTKGADEIRLCRCCKDEYLALGGLGWKLVENTELIAKQIADDDDDCICESDKNPNPLCPDHQCCWACSTQSVPITLNEHSRLWLCDGCNDKGDWCRGCRNLIDEDDGKCSPGCDYYQWEGDWTCHRCNTERFEEPYCKKCCHPDDIAVYAAEYTARCAPCSY